MITETNTEESDKARQILKDAKEPIHRILDTIMKMYFIPPEELFIVCVESGTKWQRFIDLYSTHAPSTTFETRGDFQYICFGIDALPSFARGFPTHADSITNESPQGTVKFMYLSGDVFVICQYNIAGKNLC